MNLCLAYGDHHTMHPMLALTASLLMSGTEPSIEVSTPAPPAPVCDERPNVHSVWHEHLMTHPKLARKNSGMQAKLIVGSVTAGIGTAVSLLWIFQPDADMDGPPGPSFYRPVIVSGGAAVSGLFLLTWGLVDARRLRKERDKLNQRIYLDLDVDLSARRRGARAGVAFRF